MMTIEFTNGNSYELKSKWEELTEKEFLQVLDYITVFRLGGLSILQLRTMIFLLLSGINPRLHRLPDKADQQSENIYRIASRINFMLRIDYKNAKTFANIPAEIREQLRRYLPEELETKPHVHWASKAQKSIVPDLVFAKNLVPSIGRRRHQLKGYRFDLDGKILTSSLTTAQFVDAQTVAADIIQNGDDADLDLLIAILYCTGPYSSNKAHDLSKKLPKVDSDVKKAILVNFSAIQEFLYTRTKYRLLFNDTATETTVKKSQVNIGLVSAVHSLIKAGYSDIKNSSVIDFFETMYSEIITNVTNLHRQGVEIDKIAEQTGLSITKINQIL